jgi:protein-disulfide isomerase/uncharacterized membrane protein
MMSRRRVLLGLLLALSGAALAMLLLFKHHGEPTGFTAVEAICGAGPDSGCDRVNHSPYATLAGAPLAGLGLFFYLSVALLLALAVLAEDEAVAPAAALALAGFSLALVIDLVLLGVQAFAIHAFCMLCIATYAVNAAGIVALAPARRALDQVRSAFVQPLGRLLVAGWLVGSLMAAGAVAATDVALGAREDERARDILGKPSSVAPAPAPTASVAPPPPGADPSTHYREEAERAQQQARTLQETLDDPEKLQHYLDAKASRDFDQAKVQDVELKDVPVKGLPQAPLRLVVYSDFLCPWCRNLAGGLANYLPHAEDKVVLYFKNYPLDKTCNAALGGTMHPGSCWMALGGVCANEQGKFWQYHDRVFSNPPNNPTKDDVLRIGAEAGLTPATLSACIDAPATGQKLQADIAEGRRIGVSGTPTVLINGKKLPRLNDFLQSIEKESKRMGIKPPPAT